MLSIAKAAKGPISSAFWTRQVDTTIPRVISSLRGVGGKSVMKSKIIRSALAGALALSANAGSSGYASNIDTTAVVLGDFMPFGAANPDVGNFGIATFGQTFIAPDPNLVSFSLYLENRPFGSSGSLDLRGYIGTWVEDPGRVHVGSILYESATQTMNAAGTLQKFTFFPNLILTPGNNYVAFLSISNLPPQHGDLLYGDLFGMPWAGDPYSDGMFVQIANYNSPDWWLTGYWSSCLCVTPEDVWFQATFDSATPLPAALPLFAGGLGLIGLLTRRRKQRHDAALS
jgi:hypothetical protein